MPDGTIFILYVIWPALLLYQVTKLAGAYDALRQGITRSSRNELFIILALCWVFASFLQGIAGFGAPVAVVVPLLIAVGVRPVHAVAMGALAHAWARFFGTLGVGWLATIQVADVDDLTRAAFEAAGLILIPTYLGGLLVVWLYGRGPAVRHAWPLVLILGTILGVGQMLATLISPELSTFLAAAVALIALYPLSRWRRFGEVDEQPPVMSLPMSFLPYVVLPFVTLCALKIPPLNDLLNKWRPGLPFPAVHTGYGVSNPAPDACGTIAWTTGDDGLPFVDYLRYADMVTETNEQIDQVHRGHRDRIIENLGAAGDDIGLLQKYGWLAAYHDDRAPAARMTRVRASAVSRPRWPLQAAAADGGARIRVHQRSRPRLPRTTSASRTSIRTTRVLRTGRRRGPRPRRRRSPSTSRRTTPARRRARGPRR